MKRPHLHFICYVAAILILCLAIVHTSALTSQITPLVLPKGLPLSVSGHTEYPGEVAIWIIGRTCQDHLTVSAPDGTFREELLSPNITSQLSGGQYFLIIEDTGPDGKFALESVTNDQNTTVECQGQPLFALDDAGNSYSDTAMALLEALDRPDIDDASLMKMFLVEEPWVGFDQTHGGHPGDILRFAGSTNLPVGYEIHYSILPSSGDPSLNKEQITVESGSMQVVKGSSYNYWYTDIDTNHFQSGEYFIALDSGLTPTTTTTFTLYDAGVTLPTAPVITVETLQEGPEMKYNLQDEQETVHVKTTDSGKIATTDLAFYTTDSGLIWCSAIDGDYIAWTEKTEDAGTSIYLYHIPSGITRTILEQADYFTASMDISGDCVAWVPKQSGESQSYIVLYNITTDTIEERPIDECRITAIAMDGDLVAYSCMDWSVINFTDDTEFDNNIYLYSIGNMTTRVLCNESGYQIEPSIGEGYVAWRNTNGEDGDTITICPLSDLRPVTLSPPDGGSYGTPFVEKGRVVVPLHFRHEGTPETFNTEIMVTTLPNMETTNLSLPETPRRYSPQSNDEWIVWEEREPDSSGRIVLYNIEKGTIIEPAYNGESIYNPKIDNDHFIATEYDELRGISRLWLSSFATVDPYSSERDTAKKGIVSFFDVSVIGFIIMISGVIAVSVIWKRRNR